MSESTARVALRKARYFLAQAQQAESDDKILNDHLPFAANLEAALVYARTSIEHLKAEYSSKFNERGYRHWHDRTWRDSNPLFHYFYARRNFILHQEPEPTHAQVNVQANLGITASVSVSLTVTRTDGTVEYFPAASRPEPKQPPVRASSTQSQRFFFSEHAWREKPALLYIEEFIECCESFVSAAERAFL
ncbi:hypothetical protein [Bradyrhizobium neotropicale]|uniref:Uncharacterized protein n=1 Tax=Bradyrhizobium neotropicale TaxID=1497615 RepID=A0A176YQM7_9BRAD|nr:hypothetical protein [Bradyrhizobium neotropicale]OAF09228.1 hypothetical protein AXW67_26900 [Bradyrhizobium neotropicale]